MSSARDLAAAVTPALDTAPAPPLVFTIAITGHQDIAPASADALQREVGALLDAAREQLLARQQATAIDAPRDVELRFVSALAPGADQIGAKAALDPARRAQGWRLHALLPFSRKVCVSLARKALLKRQVEQAEKGTLLTDADIEQAVAGIGTLAQQADQLFELDDWQPVAEGKQERDWQSRRYATIGQMLVRQADLMIALWDGSPPRGRGGTADVVTEARRSGVPVVWIDLEADGAVLSLMPGAVGFSSPASDLVLRYRERAARGEEDPLIPSGPATAISRAIGQVLLGEDEARAICIRRYLEEPPAQQWIERNKDTPQPGDSYRTYALLLYIFLNFPPQATLPQAPEAEARGKEPKPLRSYPLKKARRLDERSLWQGVLLYGFESGVETEQACTANAAPLLDHAGRADALGTGLGNQYRSAYVLIFALAPLAVTCAVVSTLMLKVAPDWKFLMVVAELATVGTAAAIYLRTRANDPVVEHTRRPSLLRRLFPRSQDTHQRWLDARLIAESQRGGQMLAWVGFSGRRPIDPATIGEGAGDDHEDHGGDPGHAPPRTVWAPYYANAIAALPRSPHDRAASAHQAAMTSTRIVQLAEAAGQVIEHQRSYNDLNHRRLEKLNHRLDTFSLNAIKLAAAISAFYLLLWAVNQPVPSWAQWPAVLDKDSWAYWLYGRFKYGAAFTGAVLPAVAAAAAGIRFQGDFERFAMRSKDTATRLNVLGQRAKRLAARARECGGEPCTGQPPLFEPLLDLLLDTQSVLDEDLSDWRFAYAARPITFG